MFTVRFFNTMTGAWFHEDDHTPESVKTTLDALGASDARHGACWSFIILKVNAYDIYAGGTQA